MSALFRHNVGPADRVLRLAVGALLLALAFVGPRTAWGFLGLVPLLTGAFGSCPLYTLLGIDSCPVRRG